MKVLVLGYGSMGKRHATNAKALGHEVHIFDTEVEELEDGVGSGYLWHVSDRSARRSRPDAVIIATPAATHAQLLSQWSGQAVPLLVEKPLALSVADFWKPRTRDDLRHISVAYNLRFHPQMHSLKEALGGLTGPPSSWRAVFRIFCNGETWPGKDYAEALLECSHEIDLATHLLGHTHCYGASASATRKTWCLSAKCGETPTLIEISTEKPDYERWSSISDAAGNLIWWGWDVPTGSAFLSRPGQKQERIECSADTVYAEETRAFLAGETDRFCSVYEGLGVLAVCDYARTLGTQTVEIG